MRLVKLITADKMRWVGLVSAVLITFSVNAQENSPYSRYGVGDLTPAQNVLNRGMGGVSAAYSDFQTINFVNPASYGNFGRTIFDLGTEVDVRTLKSTNPAKKFTNTNALFSYLQLGVPIGSKKMAKKDMFMGLVFGLKPMSRVNYKIQKNERIFFPAPPIGTGGSDSLNSLFEGTGGISQAYTGAGLRIKNFSVGFNFGYMFGNKDYSTRTTFINDTLAYYKSNSANNTSFGGILLNVGMQYEIKMKNKAILRLGVHGNLQQKLNASRNLIRETFTYDANSNNNFRIDSVYQENAVSGKVVLPATFGAGFVYQNANWLIGADFDFGNWAAYRFYNEKDFVRNNYTIRAGAQYLPAKENTLAKKYFSFVKYRAGVFFGPDYITAGTTSLPDFGATIGAGFPLTSLRRISYTGDYVTLNTAVELGSRGKASTGLRESITRFSVGITMNARWFQKPKYD
jgi:hypothetical protein